MSSSRIVTAREAGQWLLSDDAIPDEVVWDLAHTVMVLSEQIGNVIALHQWDDEAHGVDRCKGCGYYWPCATARSLEIEK